MAARNPSSVKSTRQSVTLPASLAADVRRFAKKENVTASRALVVLAEKGVRAEADAKAKLKASYKRFIDESNPAAKDIAGRDLIRSIFGSDSIAEDPVR